MWFWEDFKIFCLDNICSHIAVRYHIYDESKVLGFSEQKWCLNNDVLLCFLNPMSNILLYIRVLSNEHEHIQFLMFFVCKDFWMNLSLILNAVIDIDFYCVDLSFMNLLVKNLVIIIYNINATFQLRKALFILLNSLLVIFY